MGREGLANLNPLGHNLWKFGETSPYPESI